MSEKLGQPRIRCALVLSVGLSLSPAITAQVRALVDRNCDVYVIADPDPAFVNAVASVGGTFVPWRLSRGIAGPRAEVAMAFGLWRAIGAVRPDVVVAGTPKAGLYGVLIGRLRRVQRVIYTMHGLRLEGASGWRRKILWTAERLACALPHDVNFVGHDLARRARELHLVRARRGRVIGSGSAAGVDLQRYAPLGKGVSTRNRLALDLPAHAPVAGFVGRLTHDKGLEALIAVADRLADAVPGAVLALVGEADPTHPDDGALVAALLDRENVKTFGRRTDLEILYPAFDVLLLPSLREGLPTVVLEAASCAVPTVMMRCTGATDAVVPEKTGIITPIDVTAFVDAALALLAAPGRARELGWAGRERVIHEFDSGAVSASLAEYYLDGISPLEDVNAR